MRGWQFGQYGAGFSRGSSLMCAHSHTHASWFFFYYYLFIYFACTDVYYHQAVVTKRVPSVHTGDFTLLFVFDLCQCSHQGRWPIVAGRQRATSSGTLRTFVTCLPSLIFNNIWSPHGQKKVLFVLNAVFMDFFLENTIESIYFF